MTTLVVGMTTHLHPVTATHLQLRYNIAETSLLNQFHPCLLVCTVTPGRSDVAAMPLQHHSQMALQRRHRRLAIADVNGLL